MDEVVWLNFLKITSLICNGLGLVIALAFLLGPKVLMTASKVLDTLHPTTSLEKLLITKARITLGITLLIITLLMLMLVITLRA